MKKCDHFRELILSDYIDGQLDKDSAAGIEGHLLDCGECRDFFKEVKNCTVTLGNAAHQPVPAELWTALRQRIESQNQKHNAMEDFIEGLKGWIVFPKLVPVFASVTLMFLAGSVALNTIHSRQMKDREQGEYLVSLLSPVDAASSIDSNEGATPIEHYFL